MWPPQSTIAPLGAMAHLRKAQMRWWLKEPPRGHIVASSIDHRAQGRDGSFAQSANEVVAL